MDTSRETVTKAVNFQKPQRLPISGYGKAGDTTLFMPDIFGGAPSGGGLDEWQCRWSVTSQKNIGQVTGHPIADVEDIPSYALPALNPSERFATVKKRAAALEKDAVGKDRYRITAIWNTLWERMHMLYGFENCMVAMMEEDPEIEQLADSILNWCLEWIETMGQYAGDSLDAFYMTDDWGTETSLMISPALFRSFFFPRYQKLFNAVHAQGWHVWMHSCGRINDAIPMLIEAGVDVLNMQQPRVNGIEEIGSSFAGKVAFESLCDIQKTLPEGDPEAIRDEARRLMQHWGTDAGGFILADYGDATAIGTPPESKKLMLQAFQNQDRWKQ